MKVWKSVGAVAVYSAWRATAIVAVVVALLVAVGFGIGRMTDDDSGDQAAAGTPAAAPVTVQKRDDNASDTSSAADGEKPGATSAARKRAYASGYRDGARKALGGLNPGSAYFVKLVKGPSGSMRIGPSVMARPGFQYRLCRNGQSVCETAGG